MVAAGIVSRATSVCGCRRALGTFGGLGEFQMGCVMLTLLLLSLRASTKFGAGARLAAVPVTARFCIGLIVLNLIRLRCSGSDCISLIIWIRTWSLAAWTLRTSLSSCCISVVILYLRTVMLDFAGPPAEIASHLQPGFVPYFSVSTPARMWTLRGPEHRLVLHALLVALAMVPRHRLLQWDTLLMSLHHHLALLLASASVVHPRLRSTRPTRNVLSVCRLIVTTPVAVSMHKGGRQTPLRNFASSTFALPRVLSNGKYQTHALTMGNSFPYGLPQGLSYAVLPVTANFKH